MRTGLIISGTAHAVLLGIALGGVPFFEREERELQNVVSVTLEELPRAPVEQTTAPEDWDIATDVASIAMPQIIDEVIEAPTEETLPDEAVTDEVEAPSARDTDPDLTALLEALAQPEVAVEVDAPDEEQVASLPTEQPVTDVSQTPDRPTAPRPPGLSPMAAPAAPSLPRLPSAPPPPSERVEETPEEEPVEEPVAEEEPVEEPVAEEAPVEEPAEEEPVAEDVPAEPTPEELEAQEIARLASVRPRIRPSDHAIRNEPPPAAEEPETQVAAAKPEEEAPSEDTERPQQSASSTGQPTVTRRVSSGPPLTETEKDDLRFAIQRCWRVPPRLEGEEDASIVVAVEFDPNGNIVGGIRLVEPAKNILFTDLAYGAARSALIRCGRGGFDLPRAKYERWKTVEFVFDPRGVSARW